MAMALMADGVMEIREGQQAFAARKGWLCSDVIDLRATRVVQTVRSTHIADLSSHGVCDRVIEF